MRIDSAGNVGIGSTSPTTALDVNGTVRAANFVSTSGSSNFSAQGINNVSSLSIGTTSSGSDLYFGSGASRTISVQPIATAGNSLTVQAGGTSASSGNVNGGDLTLSSGAAFGTGASSLHFKTASGGAPAESMTILGNGNVGIGTTVPSDTLHLQSASGAARFERTATASSTSGGYVSVINSTAPTAVGQRLGTIAFGDRGTNLAGALIETVSDGAWSANDTPSELKFSTTPSGSGTAVERLRIDDTGRVGIGTTAPGTKLDVSGNGTSSAFRLLNGSAAKNPAVGDEYKGANSDLEIVSSGYANANRIVGNTGTTTTGGNDTYGLVVGTVRGASTYVSSAVHYRVTTGNLGSIDFLTGNGSALPTPKMTISNAGSVGIGTTTPAGSIHVHAVTGSSTIAFTNAANTVGKKGFRIANDNDRLTIQATSDAGVFSSNLVAVDHDGNVGIGTTNPSAKLHVGGTAGVDGIKFPDGTLQTTAATSEATLLATVNASASATIDFTSGIDGTYKTYLIRMIDVKSSSDADNLELLVSTNGGSTWATGASDYGWGTKTQFDFTAIERKSADTADDSIILTWSEDANDRVSNAAGEALEGEIHVNNPANSTLKKLFRWNLSHFGASVSQLVTTYGAGFYASTTAVNGIRLKFGTGNVASGTFKLYGVP